MAGLRVNRQGSPSPLGGSASRSVRAAFIGALLAYVVYLALGNLLLASSLARNAANRRPDKFAISWRSAWTLFPGHFAATGLRIGGHVRHIVWALEAERASGRLALLPLLRKELRVPRAVASGVHAAVDRVDEESLPPPPRSGGWTIYVERLGLSDVREARLGEFVLQGRGQGELGFAKTLRGGPLELLPSQIAFDAAKLQRRKDTLARDVQLRTTFAVAKHLRSEAPGIRKLSKATIDVDLSATVAGVALDLGSEHRQISWVIQTPGRLEAHLGWREGALVPGGTARVDLPLTERPEGTQIHSTAALDVLANAIRLKVVLPPAAGSRSHARAEVSLEGRNVPLPIEAAALLPRVSGDISADWRFDSFARLEALLPALQAIHLDGSGALTATLSVHKGEVVPGSALRGALENVRTRGTQQPVAANWWADAVFERSQLGWEQSLAFDGRLKVRMKDAGLLLALYAELRHLPGWVGKVVGAGELDAWADLRLRRDDIVLRSLEVREDPFDILARLRLYEKQMTGDLYVGWHALGVGVELDRGQRHVHVAHAREWYERRAPKGAETSRDAGARLHRHEPRPGDDRPLRAEAITRASAAR